MRAEEGDRRVRRTRQILHEALMALILEQSYASITVQDILDRANIGRSTFYSHFQDKDALFQYGLERMLDSLAQHLDEAGQDAAGHPVFPSLELFQHVQEHFHLYRALSGGQGLEMLFKYGRNALIQRVQHHLESQIPAGADVSIPLPILSQYLVGSLITLLQWWLENRMPYPPERMDEIYRQLVMPGMLELFHPTQPSG